MIETNIFTGLSSQQVKNLPKNIPAKRVGNFGLMMRILWAQVASFFFVLLIVSGALSLYLGQKVDGFIFFAITLINTAIGFFQEYKSNKSAQLLEKLVSHVVTVRRDGVLVRIPHTEVVLGDIVLLSAGDIAVVDMIVREAKNAFVDSSIITGETIPIEAHEGSELASGVHIASGTIIAQVTSVGNASSLAQYAQKIQAIKKHSAFEGYIATISRSILGITVACLLVVCVVNVLVAQGMSLSEYVLYAVAMLVGVVPESLPLIITIILTHEALRLAEQQVLVKKLSVLENLGSIKYLFTDKTGTITENTLKVKAFFGDTTLAKDAFVRIASSEYERSPMDIVFDTAIQAVGVLYTKGEPVEFSPFEIDRGYAIYTFPEATYIRGSYTAIASLVQEDVLFMEACNAYEKQGQRVLACAKSTGETYSIVGAVVFEDPLKSDAVELYKTLEELGIEVKVITGDSVEVGGYVGNILSPASTGESVCDMSTVHSDTDMEKYFVYAKCKPEQKSLLIDEHLDKGVVAFLGEGVNDALALRRADIGFVVQNASDIARQAGDVMLLEKSLAPIVSAVTMSRRAFIRIRTYLLCTLTGNIGTLFSLTLVVVFWQQIPMLPIQILLNNLLTDMPLMFLLKDTIDPAGTKRSLNYEVKKFFGIVILFAVVSSLFDFVFFFMFKGYDISILRTGWLVFSVLSELVLVLSLRSELSILKAPHIQKTFAIIICAAGAIAIALPYTPLAPLFHLARLGVSQIGIILGIVFVYMLANELVKYLRKRKMQVS